MAKFCLEDSDEYYLALSESPKRFEADSPVTNVFFDDTNGQVFTVRSGGVTGVTVTGMDETKSTSFRMEDKGPIISIKFSPDHQILAIQRNRDNQNTLVEFVNFKDLAPTNVEYSHTCKWKNAKILGFVWPKVNEITFITDHGLELLQVLPEKKQLKTLKSTAFSGAWFSWCPQSKTVLLAGNNGALLQPFSLCSSTITRLQKLELESSRPVSERDVFVLRVRDVTWCALIRHASSGPTEVCLLSVSGARDAARSLRTGRSGRFALNVVDDLVVVHHQSSQTSQIFDIEESAADGESLLPVVDAATIRPAVVDGEPCPMYAATWVVFQPHYVVDARLGCLWSLALRTRGLAHEVPVTSLPRLVSVLQRRTDGRAPTLAVLRQLAADAEAYLDVLGDVFDAVNVVYRAWADSEVARNTAGAGAGAGSGSFPVVITQTDVCEHVFQDQTTNKYLVQVVTGYLASLSRHSLTVSQCVSELYVRACVRGARTARLRASVRRGALGHARPLACALLALARRPPDAQIALDMLWRLRAHEDVVEVLLSWDEAITAAGAARQAGRAWSRLPARKLLSAARASGEPACRAVLHALRARNLTERGSEHFLKGEQCDSFLEYYNQIMSE